MTTTTQAIEILLTPKYTNTREMADTYTTQIERGEMTPGIARDRLAILNEAIAEYVRDGSLARERMMLVNHISNLAGEPITGETYKRAIEVADTTHANKVARAKKAAKILEEYLAN